MLGLGDVGDLIGQLVLPAFELVLLGDRVDVHRPQPGDLAAQVVDVGLDRLPVDVERVGLLGRSFVIRMGISL